MIPQNDTIPLTIAVMIPPMPLITAMIARPTARNASAIWYETCTVSLLIGFLSSVPSYLPTSRYRSPYLDTIGSITGW